MKRLFLTVLCLFVLPSITNAHTDISSANPSSGQVIKQHLKEIVLTFQEDIESLSTMSVKKSGKEIPLARVELKQKQMVGTLSSPLENGEYVINWSIVGSDGHPVTGEIPFTVQMEQKEEAAQDGITTEKDDTKQVEEKNRFTEPTGTANNSSSEIANMIIVVLLLILLFGVIKLFKGKR